MSRIGYSSSIIWIPPRTSLAQLDSKIHSPLAIGQDFLVCWMFEFMLQFDGSGCITVVGAWFLSILFSYMPDYYFTTLILRRFEVWHSGNVMIECISEEAIYYYVAGNFFPTACTVIGYFEVTWHIYLTMKLFPAKNNVWEGNIAKSLMSEGNSAPSQCFPQLRLGKHWDSWETKLTVFRGFSFKVFIAKQ